MPQVNRGSNHKVLKLYSAGGGKRHQIKENTQEGNALDTIAFVCLARSFMHGSNFLLLLEICQSFQLFHPLLEAVL